MTNLHEVQRVRVDNEHLHLVVDGRECRAALERCSPRLKAARQSERDAFKVLGSGYGIHPLAKTGDYRWPAIDEDLSVRWLLEHAEAVGQKSAVV